MYVYVQHKDGRPLMPTKRLGKVRHLLKDGKAKVVKRTPFTIRLLYDTKDFTQPITLGVDAGSKTIGLSATTDEDELYAANVEFRTDIVKLLSDRREWIEKIVSECDEIGVAVFMKESLRTIMGKDFRQDKLPWEVSK